MGKASLDNKMTVTTSDVKLCVLLTEARSSSQVDVFLHYTWQYATSGKTAAQTFPFSYDYNMLLKQEKEVHDNLV